MTVKHFYRLSKKQNFARAVGMERRWGWPQNYCRLELFRPCPEFGANKRGRYLETYSRLKVGVQNCIE